MVRPIQSLPNRRAGFTSHAGVASACLMGLVAALLASPPNLSAGTIVSLTWNGSQGDNLYSNAGNWTPGIIPVNDPVAGTGYEVLIGLDFSNPTVNLDVSPVTINTLSMGLGSTLNLAGNVMTVGSSASGGEAGVLTNGGTLNVSSDRLILDISAQSTGMAPASTNTGTISLGGGSFEINHGLGSGIAVLTGGGTIQLSPDVGPVAPPYMGTLSGVQGTETLITDNLITGGGTITGLTVASASNGLTIQGGNGLFNSGTLQSLLGQLTLDAIGPDPTLQGGFFENQAGGKIETNGNNILVKVGGNSGPHSRGSAIGQPTALVNDANATIAINNGNTLTYQGDGTNSAFYLTNNGSINLNNGTLKFDANGGNSVMFNVGPSSGASTITLTNGTIAGATGNELLISTAGQTIAGSGSITGLKFQNNGTVVANGVLTISNLANFSSNALNGGTYIVNGGSGSLVIQNIGAGGIITNNADIVLKGGGQILGAGGIDALAGSLTTNNGSLTLSSGTTLNLANALTNTGSIALAGTGDTLTAHGFTNSGSISVATGAIADFRTGNTGTFSNLVNGTLSGGTYNLSGRMYIDPSSGGPVTTIGSGTSLTLNGSGSLISGGMSGDYGVTASALALTTNLGTLSLTGGASLAANGSFNNAGSLSVSGFDPSTFSGSRFSSTGLTNSGIITIGAGGSLDARGGTFGNLTNGVLSGNYTVGGTFAFNAPSGIANIAGSVTLDGLGSISNAAANGRGILYDTGTGTLNDALSSSLTAVSGALTLQNGVTLNLANGLTNSGSIVLADGANTLTAAGFTNNGSIKVGANAVADFRTGIPGSFGSASGGVLSGTYNLTGQMYVDSVGGGSIRSIGPGGSVTLNGSGMLGFDPLTNALGHLTGNQGVLTLNAGASLTTPGNFDNGSVVTVQNGANLTVTGTFSNSQTNSMVTVRGVGSTLTSSGLTNNGMLTVGPGAVLDASNGVFTNLSNGVLDGGNYYVAGTLIAGAPAAGTPAPGAPPSLITAIGPNAKLTLDGAGAASVVDKLGNDLLGQSLNEVAGTLSIGNSTGGFFEFDPNPPNGAFTVDQNGLLSLGAIGGNSAPFGAASVNIGFSSGGASLVNNGSIVLAGVGTFGGGFSAGSELFVTGPLINNTTGNVYLQGGGQTLAAYGLSNTGTIRIDAHSVLDVTAGPFTNLDANGNLSGGTYHVGGTFLINAPIQSVGAGTTLSLEGVDAGVFVGSAPNSALTALSQNDGTLGLKGGAFINTQAPGGFINTGTITTDGIGGNLFEITGNFKNAAAGTLLAAGGFSTAPGVVNLIPAGQAGRDILAATGNITNDGSIVIGAGDFLVAGFTGFDPSTATPAGNGDYIQDAGGTTQVDGTLVAGNVSIAASSLLTGTGVIQGSLTNAGTVNPGDSGAPGSMLITGNYSQSGLLLLDFGGTGLTGANPWKWDFLTVNGIATLGGTLGLQLEPGFAAAAGDQFLILSSLNAITTNFATFSFGTFGNGLTFQELFGRNGNGDITSISLDVVASATGLSGTSLNVLSSSQGTPEPSTLATLGAGLLAVAGLGHLRRRLRRAFAENLRHEC